MSSDEASGSAPRRSYQVIPARMTPPGSGQPLMASGALVVRYFCPDDAADIGSRDAQDFGVLVLEHEEGAIPVVPPDPGQGLSRAILECDLVRLSCHTVPYVVFGSPSWPNVLAATYAYAPPWTSI